MATTSTAISAGRLRRTVRSLPSGRCSMTSTSPPAETATTWSRVTSPPSASMRSSSFSISVACSSALKRSALLSTSTIGLSNLSSASIDCISGRVRSPSQTNSTTCARRASAAAASDSRPSIPPMPGTSISAISVPMSLRQR